LREAYSDAYQYGDVGPIQMGKRFVLDTNVQIIDEHARIKVLLERLSDAVSNLFSEEKNRNGIKFETSPSPEGMRPTRKQIKIEPEYADIAEQMYLERRKRDELFQIPCLFGEPAWDMLLDLLIARERSIKLSVSAVTQGSGSPATTALRYVSVLEKVGLIERATDQNDARRSWVRLSDHGFKMMTLFLDVTSGIKKNTRKNLACDTWLPR